MPLELRVSRVCAVSAVSSMTSSVCSKSCFFNDSQSRGAPGHVFGHHGSGTLRPFFALPLRLTRSPGALQIMHFVAWYSVGPPLATGHGALHTCMRVLVETFTSKFDSVLVSSWEQSVSFAGGSYHMLHLHLPTTSPIHHYITRATCTCRCAWQCRLHFIIILLREDGDCSAECRWRSNWYR